MAIRKDPNAIQVNGALVFIKDPSATSGLFSKWRRLPGLGSFTMPAEAGSVTDTPGIDGSISFANVAGVGNISGTIIALNAGVVHRFMEGRAKSGEAIVMSLIRPARGVEIYKEIAPATLVAAAAAGRIVVPAGDLRKRVKADLREGMIVGIWPDNGLTPAANTRDELTNTTPFIDYEETPTSANDGHWRTILEVAEDGAWIDVAPNFSTDQTVAASKKGNIQIRQPGRTYHNIHGTVNQFDRGDAQAGGGISSNLQFIPSSSLDVAEVERRFDGGKTIGGVPSVGGILDGYTQAGGFVI